MTVGGLAPPPRRIRLALVDSKADRHARDLPVRQEERIDDLAWDALTALAERAAAVGGTLRTGVAEDGGFEVVAELPLGPEDTTT